MNILVVNPNTSASMTRTIEQTAARAASPGTRIIAVQPAYGADAIDSAMESYLSAVAVMDRVLSVAEPYDAVVMAGFGEHGREGVQEIVDVPVLDIAESSAHVAQMIGRTYSVVTTLQRSVGAIEDRLRLAGLADRCASVRACGLSTSEVDDDPAGAMEAIVAEAEIAVRSDHAEVICLGCGGMAGLDEAITTRLGVPVVDGVAAGVRLAEALVGLGLRTSKVCTYAPPEPKTITAWPLSRHLDLETR
ncbi:Asp/Glu/hydantoin racemase [Planotetraspora thailandica]|uniref:Hydantoin racemase n=1 Tax=Planotetraspora thailandica TaxID=487172 RepID=A0A8J3Y000_9ACTN|nr:aspartate/glutamate racemase family protein [Planotetraspora thailandica]GII58297.1 Asp/Glu/hydantoin racemase [Planotetraspora thailandica]